MKPCCSPIGASTEGHGQVRGSRYLGEDAFNTKKVMEGQSADSLGEGNAGHTSCYPVAQSDQVTDRQSAVQGKYLANHSTTPQTSMKSL